ncbi:MAG TPA: NADH-quinone oxidoreductase subunit N, partial [Agitococcus sp.]|nr:NADH-quinone oxidoreductase subunit N [Agitococcus sp.]HNC03138.1 NADH-quinone oxidoreductase subunit N [Agitococcus sp.]
MNLTFETFLPLLPVGILGATTVVVMLAIAFLRHHWWNATITVVGLNLALASVIALVWQGTAPTAITPLLVVDNFAYFYMALILVAALACSTLTHAFIDSYKNNREEMYLLLLIATAGALVLVC